MDLEDVLRVVTVACASVGVGVLVTALLAQIPTVRRLSAADGLAFKRASDTYINRIAPAPILLMGIVGIVLLVTADDPSSETVAFTVVGAVAAIVLFGVSAAVGARLERAIHDVPEDQPDPAFPDLFGRWATLHRVRTGLGLLALAAFVVALLTASDGWSGADVALAVAMAASAIVAGVLVTDTLGQAPAVRSLPDGLAPTVSGHLETAVDRALGAPAALAAVAGLVAALVGDDGDAAFEVLAIAGGGLAAATLLARGSAPRAARLLAGLAALGCFIAAGLSAG